MILCVAANLNYRVVAMYVYDATQVGVKCDYTRSASWAKASHKEPTRPMSIASPVHRSCTGKCAFCDCIARKYRYVTYIHAAPDTTDRDIEKSAS